MKMKNENENEKSGKSPIYIFIIFGTKVLFHL